MRYRTVLPVILGIVAVVLIAWQEHYIQLIRLSGDDATPVWPYETPFLFLWGINTPAVDAADQLSSLLHLAVGLRTSFRLVAILVFWWWIGTRLDSGVLRRRRHRHPRRCAVFLAAAAAISFYAGVHILLYEFPTRVPGHIADVEYLLPFACASVRALWYLGLGCGISFATAALARQKREAQISP